MSDKFFTGPGVIGIVVTGLILAVQGGFPLLGTDWILWTIVLFSISGFVFGLRVAPLQRKLLAMANTEGQSKTFDYERYHAVALQWEVWGIVALLTPLAGLALMVLKPL